MNQPPRPTTGAALPTDAGSGPSFWKAGLRPRTFPALTKDIAADICVIGAGIAGLTTAFLLRREGRSVALLEAGSVGGGQTCRTTGHLCSAIDDRFSAIEKRRGPQAARLVADSHGAAVDWIEALVSSEKIDCDFERVDGHLFPPPGGSLQELEEEMAAARRAGVTGVQWEDRAPLPAFDTGRCLRFPRQAQFHALKYISALAGLLERSGASIFERTRAVDVRHGSRVRVRTDGGQAVTCDVLVEATHVPLSSRVLIPLKQAAYRSYVIAGRVPRRSVPRALFWDTLDPYHYLRFHPLDLENDMAIVGGEDHKTGQGKGSPYEALENWTRERLPGFGRVEHRWSGQIMEPADGQAFIGRIPADGENVFVATGDSGNGLTHGTLAGMLLKDLIQGRKNPWASLYAPSRLMARSLGPLLEENANTAVQYVDWFKPGQVRSPDEIAPGSGAVAQQGLSKTALYRDPGGSVQHRSAVCPHLGGLVRWNALEKTWDCPCHGSRFDVRGRVLNGPSQAPLKE
jgi:glycine/D-amino acid oxidase-like deaminating enzyme/nitrite reductase/ring-hydroxylating ferredoxin subunit